MSFFLLVPCHYGSVMCESRIQHMQCACDRYADGALANAAILCMGPVENGKHVCYPTPCVNTTRCNGAEVDDGEIIISVCGSFLVLLFLCMCIVDRYCHPQVPQDPQDAHIPQVPQVPEEDAQDAQDLHVLELPQASAVMVAERR